MLPATRRGRAILPSTGYQKRVRNIKTFQTFVLLTGLSKSLTLLSVRGRKVIFCISDLQIPFEHRDALSFVTHVVKTFSKKEDKIEFVNMGDELDQHTLGKYSSNPDGFSAGFELELSKDQLKPWFREFPKMSVCTSNHTWRAYKKAFDVGLPRHFLKSIAEVYEAPPGWV